MECSLRLDGQITIRISRVSFCSVSITVILCLFSGLHKFVGHSFLIIIYCKVSKFFDVCTKLAAGTLWPIINLYRTTVYLSGSIGITIKVAIFK